MREHLARVHDDAHAAICERVKPALVPVVELLYRPVASEDRGLNALKTLDPRSTTE
jgi:hypothetical protein